MSAAVLEYLATSSIAIVSPRIPAPAAAVLLGDHQAEQPGVAEDLEEVLRVGRGGVDLPGPGRDLLLREPADRAWSSTYSGGRSNDIERGSYRWGPFAGITGGRPGCRCATMCRRAVGGPVSTTDERDGSTLRHVHARPRRRRHRRRAGSTAGASRASACVARGRGRSGCDRGRRRHRGRGDTRRRYVDGRRERAPRTTPTPARSQPKNVKPKPPKHPAAQNPPPAIAPQAPVSSPPAVVVPPPVVPQQPQSTTPAASPPSVLQWSSTPASLTIPAGGHRTLTVHVVNPSDGTVTLGHPLSCAPTVQDAKGHAIGYGVCVEMAQLMAPHDALTQRYVIYATDTAVVGGDASKPGIYIAASRTSST